MSPSRLALAAALVWRYRDTTWTAPRGSRRRDGAQALLWPLLVWFAATERARSAARALGIGVALTFVAWAAIGFTGLTSYADRLEAAPYERSYSFLGMAAALGPQSDDRTSGDAGLRGALLGAVVHLGRKGDEVQAFTCAIVAALAFAPVRLAALSRAPRRAARDLATTLFGDLASADSSLGVPTGWPW